MTVRIHPMSEINQRANDALVGELGVVDTIRFLNQFRAGDGDYTTERHRLFQNLSVKDIASEIRAKRASRS